MLTEKIYSSMIGRHYSKWEIKMLCALIDQRIEYRLPNFALRARLLELISNQLVVNKELKKKVVRDLEAYPESQESSYKIVVTLVSGEKCSMNINLNTLQWTDKSGMSLTAPITYGVSWFSNSPERTLSATFEGENGEAIQSPIISRESVVKTDNFGVLMLLLQMPVGEPKLILEKSCPDCKFGPVYPVKTDRGTYEPSKLVKYICGNCQTVFYVKGGL